MFFLNYSCDQSATVIEPSIIPAAAASAAAAISSVTMPLVRQQKEELFLKIIIYLSTDGNNYSSMQIGEKNNFHVTIKSKTLLLKFNHDNSLSRRYFFI